MARTNYYWLNDEDDDNDDVVDVCFVLKTRILSSTFIVKALDFSAFYSYLMKVNLPGSLTD